MEHDWIFDRCREVQRSPNGHLDLWAREHYKSSLITFGLTIQDILNDPEITIGIFSHTKPHAKAFLRQIKYELESNTDLQAWFPDVLWDNPRKQAPKWTEDEGITVRRKGNPKEATLECSGLVDGQPTGRHYRLRIYDDVVVPESVTSPEMIAKTTQAYELSDNLGTEGGQFRVIGTRYHFADTYGEMMKRGIAKPRIHACTRDGTDNFTPENCVLMKPETLVLKRRNQGPYTFGTQMLLNPKGDDSQTFKYEWMAERFILSEPSKEGANFYILGDPANSKRKTNDYTTFWVVGLTSDGNYMLADLIRDRLNLTERTRALFDLHRYWQPKAVGYEQYGMQADVSHIKTEMETQNYRFHITELGGQTPKHDRIRRLIPLFEQGRIWSRRSRTYTDYESVTRNLIDVFFEEEYKAFPVMAHDDMLDALARIEDPAFKPLLRWPKPGSDVPPVVETRPTIQRHRQRSDVRVLRRPQ